jgi:hypothetical protein
MATSRKSSPLVLLAVPVVVVAFPAQAENPPPLAPVALVERVVDGDTVVVRLDG